MFADRRCPRLSIMGDSISTFEGCNPEGFHVFYEGPRLESTGVCAPCDTWWGIVAQALGARVLSNGSFSGSMVEGAGFPAASSEQRVAALASQGETPDMILVFIGINDYGWGGAANQAAAGAKATPAAAPSVPFAQAAMAAEGALVSFEEAYGLMLGRMRAAYPAARVYCCTLLPGRVTGAGHAGFAWRLRGVSLHDYNRAIRTQAQAHGCLVADLESYGLDYDAVDGTHPTKRGMCQLAALVLSSLAQAGEHAVEQAAAALFDEAFAGVDMRSDEPCDRESCIGCAFARSTDNAWSLVCEMPR